MTAPPDIELYRPDGRAPAVLLCDHAGNRIPKRLGDLGVSQYELRRHIGYDIGAAWVTYELSDRLDAPSVLCHVSRLVMDVNRPPRHPTAMPAISDGTEVPGNRDLDEQERRRRLFGVFAPYHRAVARAIARFRRDGREPALVAVHSFTPRMGGIDRPWHVGVLWNTDRRLSGPMLQTLRARGDLSVGDNQPYTGQAEFGFTIGFHGERAGLPHVMLELRQDLIETRDGARAWAQIVAEALEPALAALAERPEARDPEAPHRQRLTEAGK